MKKITINGLVLLALFFTSIGLAQTPKVVVVGANHVTPDGITFVVTDALTASEVIYFTEDEYESGMNRFNPATAGESVVTYTADAAGLAVGQVVFLKETASNTLTVTCTQGANCGTAVVSTPNFAIGTSGDQIYAYSDGNADPTDGVTQVHSVLYTFAGNIPAGEDPTTDHPTAVVIDGFASGAPSRTEYFFSPASVRDGVSQTSLENPLNYFNGAANADLSLVEFTNLNLAGANPVLTVTRSPAALDEDAAGTIDYTFMLDSNAVGDITVNFSVGGSATFSTDYTQTGAATFMAGSGTVTITNGTNSAVISIDPSVDTDLEPDETVILTATAGTGYDVGTPGAATGTITNDDTASITPSVAVVGTNHTGTEGFSFVALVDIPGGTTVYFTENPFDNNLLAFSGSEAVASWTAPAGGVTRGEVIVAMETAPNTFSPTCSSGAGAGTCGSVSVVSGMFMLANNGEAFFSYTDTDGDHTNGVTQVESVLFTGTTTTPGGNVPAGEDPSTVYTGAVVVDGFPAVMPSRTEYRFPPERGVTVDQANFQNTANWFHAQGAATLSDIVFANIIISAGSTNPTLTLTVSPTTSVEDSGVGMVYTFTLSAPAAVATTVNFTVAGTATLTTDYTVIGADTFTATNGTATIPMGGTSVAVTVTPVVDTDVEPTETVNLMIDSGTGYDGGSPNSATGSIINDDTSASDPLVALMGMSHSGTDGFSFAAAQDIPGGTVVYFTEDEFDNMTLLFSSGEAVLQWTSPAGQIDAGDVITIEETVTPDNFTIACSDTSGNGCGTVAVIVGGFALATDGETMYSYEDSDTDPTNGVDDIYSVMYTGVIGTPGGNLPAIQDPSGIFLNALVVDGFPATPPAKTEYTPASRAIPVGSADFENPANYDHGFTNPPVLSTVPFANLSIIVEFTAPADLCIDAGVQAGLGGGTPPGGVYSGPGVTDDGNGMTYSFDPAAAGVGVHTITYTLGGGSASDDIEVFALPTVAFTAPADLCIDAGVQAGLGGGTPTGGVYSGPGVTDDGNGMTYSFDPAAAGVGVHTLTYTFTDGNSCTNSATDDIEVFALPTVTFTAPPSPICPDTVLTGLGGGTPTGGVYSGPGVTDDGNGMTYTFDSGASGTGTHTITYTFTDGNGCTNSASDTVTVEDTEDPVVTCPADITVGNDPGICGAVVNFTPTATDNCSVASIVSVPASGSVFPVGTTLVTVTATDGSGNTDVCTFNVTVNDTEDPVASCPADITVGNDPGECGAIVNYTPTATDNCPGVTVASVPASGSFFPVGTTLVTVTATDAAGNTDVCTFNVTVNDVEPPVIACPADITVNTDPGVCGATVAFPDALAFDNCSATVAQTGGLTSGSLFPVGPNVVEFTATDPSGNQSVCSFTITVEDNEPAMAVCQDITIQLDSAGMASITAADIDGGSTDACGIASISADPVNFSCADVGPNNVTLTVTDVNGNVSTCIAVVTVEDNVAPVAVCQDITVQLDVNGTVTISPADVDGGSSDACGIGSLSLDEDTFDCSNVGDNVVTLTVTDNNGNTSSCTATVTVEDNVSPDLVCMDITLPLDENGMATITPADVIASNTDACGIDTSAVDITDFDCDDIGMTFTVQVFTIDVNGNLATCFANVTVVDDLGPVIDCPDDQTVDPGAGNVFYEVPDYFGTGEATVTDNCTDPVTITSQDPAPGTLLADGVYTVTLTAEDDLGNVGTCTFELTVESTLGAGDIEITSSNIAMYPNPATGIVYLSNSTNVELEEAQIFDLTGRLIRSFDLQNMGTEKALDISHIASANYHVIIRAANGQFISKRLLVE